MQEVQPQIHDFQGRSEACPKMPELAPTNRHTLWNHPRQADKLRRAADTRSIELKRITLITLWAVLTCILAGAVATGLGMPSLWGGGSGAFLEYALPFPLGWGFMHLPGLVGFGTLIAATAGYPGKWRPATQLCALGTGMGVITAYVVVEAVRGLPLLMFLSVDAATAFAAASLIPGSSPGSWSRSAKQMMLLGPAALVIIAVLVAPLLRDRYRIPMTDTVETADGTKMRVFVVLQGRGRSTADECEALREVADSYRHRFTQRGTDKPMDGVVLLFDDSSKVGRNSAGAARMKYEWRHNEPDRCRG